MRPRTRQPAPARRLTRLGHVAVWMIPVVVLAVNCVLVAAGDLAGVDEGAERLRVRPSRGSGAAARADRESPRRRSRASCSPRGLPGLVLLLRRDPIRGLGVSRILRRRVLLGLPGRAAPVARFLAAGAAYLRLLHGAGGGRRGGDSTSCAGGCAPVRHGVDRLDRWVMVGCRSCRHPDGRVSRYVESIRGRGSRSASRSCRAGRRRALLWVVDRVRRHVKPGERLLYEEGGYGPARRARSVSSADGSAGSCRSAPGSR